MTTYWVLVIIVLFVGVDIEKIEFADKESCTSAKYQYMIEIEKSKQLQQFTYSYAFCLQATRK